MSTIEINKLVASVLVAGLVFMAINVAVDEILPGATVEETVYPASTDEGHTKTAAVTEQAAEAPMSLSAMLAAADPGKGKKLAKKCLGCHDLSRGGRNKVGPALWGVVGDLKAARAGFAYTGALSNLGGEWGYEALDTFLANPKAYAPGNKMAFVGVKDVKDRANLVAYLRTLSDDPLPLPSDG